MGRGGHLAAEHDRLLAESDLVRSEGTPPLGRVPNAIADLVTIRSSSTILSIIAEGWLGRGGLHC